MLAAHSFRRAIITHSGAGCRVVRRTVALAAVARWGLLLAVVLAFSACGSNDGRTPSGDACNAGSTGMTSCAFGSSTCSAGQFCEDDAFCEPGCTSNANCLAGETCVRGAGEAVGACAPCSTPPPAGDAGQMMSSSVTRCQMAMMRAFECGHIDNADLAVGQTGCQDTLTESERVTFATCVETAAGCPEVGNCLGGGGGGTCAEDSECITTPGVTHQICSGGLCVFGCRAAEDCGADYTCDDFTMACFPL